MDYGAILEDAPQEAQKVATLRSKRNFMAAALRIVALVEVAALIVLWLDTYDFDLGRLWSVDVVGYDPQASGLDVIIVIAMKCFPILFHCCTQKHVVSIRTLT